MAFDDFKYLVKENHQYEVKGVNDVALYNEIYGTVGVLGLSSEFENIFRVVAAVLLLGNIEFDDSTFDGNSNSLF
jgi:myosin heavy subunit